MRHLPISVFCDVFPHSWWRGPGICLEEWDREHEDPDSEFAFLLFNWIFVSFSADICLIFVTEIQDDVWILAEIWFVSFSAFERDLAFLFGLLSNFRLVADFWKMIWWFSLSFQLLGETLKKSESGFTYSQFNSHTWAKDDLNVDGLCKKFRDDLFWFS